jgi:hypothetical protein
MEIERIAPAQAVDKALAAWAAAVETLDAEVPNAADAAPVRAGIADLAAGAGVQAAHDPPVPVSEPALPGMDNDAGHEATTLQTAWRAPPHTADVPRGNDAKPLATPAAQSELAVPAGLLVQATLSGLQVEPATHWPLPHPGAPEWAHVPRRADRRHESPPRRDDGRQAHESDPEPESSTSSTPEAPRDPDAAPTDVVIDADADGAWCDTLSAALRAALSGRIAPQALLAAAEQWRRGRCVVLACPQGSDPAGPAWAFVLWPRPAVAHDADAALALFGLRVEARLHWHMLPPTTLWCHVRMVREHHPRRGRQLVAPDADVAPADRTGPCEVQLGPVLARSPGRCDVRVQIQAAQRFWAALGRQWSVQVIVGARPLLAARTAAAENRPC